MRRLISAARDPDPRIAPPAFTFTTDYDCVHKSLKFLPMLGVF
jgi:hypothetical protein